jgi:ATP-dependent Lon protease
VLEIGGVKEKVLAAYRAGLREVLLPKANEKDLREVPDAVREHMTFTFVTAMDEVLRLALLPAPVPRADLAPEAEGLAPAEGPVADDLGLTVGEHRRTPGAREGDVPVPVSPAVADVAD